MGENRYVGLACPLCDEESPTCDQKVDPHRTSLIRWWQDHRSKHMPVPRVERRPVPDDNGRGDGHADDA